MGREVDADGVPGNAELVAGGPDESIFQPEWSPDGTLYFVSDRSGWWNLYRCAREASSRSARRTRSSALPQWVLRDVHLRLPSRPGASSAPTSSAGLAPRRPGHGERRARSPIETPYRASRTCALTRHGRVVFLGGSPTEPACIVSAGPVHRAASRCLRRSGERGRSTPATSPSPSRSSSRPRRPDGARASTTRRATATSRRRRASAAAAGDEPRRADGGDHRRPSTWGSSTGPAAASPCST